MRGQCDDIMIVGYNDVLYFYIILLDKSLNKKLHTSESSDFPDD